MKKQREQSRQKPELIKKELKVTAALGLITLGGFFGYKAATDSSGEYKIHEPTTPKEFTIDNQHNMLSWNMHSETPGHLKDFKELISQHDPDVIALQEVDTEDTEFLSNHFSDWYVTHVVADDNAKLDKKGFGNAILSKQKPEDVEVLKIDGTSTKETLVRTVKGAIIDVARAETSLKNTKDGRQEKRAALAMTVKVRQGQSDELKDVRIITGHIAGMPIVHSDQYDSLMKFIKDNRHDGRPTIFCGDLNAAPEKVIPRFAELGFITPETDATSLSGKVIDYCSYKEERTLGLGRVAVLASHKTDHYPLLAKWEVGE